MHFQLLKFHMLISKWNRILYIQINKSQSNDKYIYDYGLFGVDFQSNAHIDWLKKYIYNNFIQHTRDSNHFKRFLQKKIREGREEVSRRFLTETYQNFFSHQLFLCCNIEHFERNEKVKLKKKVIFQYFLWHRKSC